MKVISMCTNVILVKSKITNRFAFLRTPDYLYLRESTANEWKAFEKCAFEGFMSSWNMAEINLPDTPFMFFEKFILDNGGRIICNKSKYATADPKDKFRIYFCDNEDVLIYKGNDELEKCPCPTTLDAAYTLFRKHNIPTK